MGADNGRLTGFGFGPIQAGLFLLEAQRGGGFDRLTVAEVNTDRLAALNRSGGGSPVVYCAENNTRSASLLRAAVEEELRISGRGDETNPMPYKFADTVIGKMSSVVPVKGTGRSGGMVGSGASTETDADGGTTGLTLEPFAEGSNEAFLVEAFNAIEVSHPSPMGFGRFLYRPDLHPFEEAKLYGHNAVHALAGFLARELGLATIADCPSVDGFVEFLRDAFIEESGKALCRRYGKVDYLFTGEGFRESTNDLLVRMTNPYLADSVERVIRDPVRKLGWNDRLIGTLRLCLHHDVRPDGNTSEASAGGNTEVESVLAWVEQGAGLFLDWRESLAGRAPAERGAPRITPRL